MKYLKLIRARRSVRTFDGRLLTEEHIEKLRAFAKTIKNPYDIPVEFFFLDKAATGLSSPVISGETMYAAAKIKAVPHSEEAFGYAFEQLVLYARYLGIGTTLIGGTMNREAFETAVLRESDERMYLVTPLGYPADKMSLKETAMRTAVRADKRKPFEELFFENDFTTSLKTDDDTILDALEAVRLAPSAVNKQPWRIVKCENSFHFYVIHSKGFANEQAGDMQKIDMGIALAHFMMMTGGTLSLTDPQIPVSNDTEYIATVTVGA
ncbi:MAG: nitroreductase [Oscillospiraceae bacterium]|nr:nitroreductase [Oscillospiraceae bacterium]